MVMMIQKMNLDDFDKIYKIMDESFPLDEHRDYQEQRELLNKPQYTIYVCYDSKPEEIKGFMAVWELGDFGFIEHFAVNKAYRNAGIGTAMLQELIQLLKQPICLEVELPDNEIARRRIDFYKRNGFYENEFPYMQPAISPGRNPIPLILMTSGGSISGNVFEEIKALLYNTVYQ